MNNNIKYRAIALDLDGTLTNNQKIITPLTLSTLIKVQKDKAHIILASGRPTYGIEPIANQLHIDLYGGFILSYNGGKIIEWKTKKELFSQFLPANVIPEIYDYAKKTWLRIARIFK